LFASPSPDRERGLGSEGSEGEGAGGRGRRTLAIRPVYSEVTQILSSIALFVLCGWFFISARRMASSSRSVRRGLILGALAAIGVAAVIIFYLPYRIPDTPGSPAALVVVALLWVMGAVLLLFAVPSLVGALVAKPPLEGSEG